MRAARSAWRSSFTTGISGSARTVTAGRDSMKGSYLGPAFSPNEIEAYLKSVGAVYERIADPELFDRVAAHLADERIIGWFDGRMEFGPRSLGARSILGDPRSPRMQAQMNLKIKFREGFRPFAPSVLRERVADYFELDADSPYMLLVAPVKKERCIPLTAAQHELWGIDKLNVPRSDIPAVTHIDYSARIQTVTKEANGRYYDLIKAFERRTGCAVVVNTSFNVRGEPIVCTPEDAYGASCARTSTCSCSVRSCSRSPPNRNGRRRRNGSRNSSSTDGGAGAPVRPDRRWRVSRAGGCRSGGAAT